METGLSGLCVEIVFCATATAGKKALRLSFSEGGHCNVRSGRPLEIRHAAEVERRLCVGAAFHTSPQPDGHRGVCAGQRQYEHYPLGDHSGRSAGLHGGDAGQLFYCTQIPVCLWFLTRDKKGDNGKRRGPESAEKGKNKNAASSEPLRFKTDRTGKTLFIDARKKGTLIDRDHRELTDDDITRLATTDQHWQQGEGNGNSITRTSRDVHFAAAVASSQTQNEPDIVWTEFSDECRNSAT